MQISVIIPVYNEADVIGDCLKSLAKQNYPDFEVVLVDDGSTDQTAHVLSELKIKNLKLKILRSRHMGAGSARNLGVEKSKGKILVFLDADMTFKSDFLTKLTTPITGRTAIGTFSKEEYLENTENIWAICWNLNKGLPKDRMHNLDYPDTQKVFRAILREKFVEAGGFDPRAGYADDSSLSDRLGVEATVAEGAVFFHKNPGKLKEVYIQSKWMAKRKYKLGYIGLFITLVVKSIPFSVIFGFAIALREKIPQFFIFKLVSDFGQFVGLLEFISGKVAK